MRLVRISDETLVNPEYISHIMVRKEVPNKPPGKYVHDYPIYRITMYDGTWYDIAFKQDYYDEGSQFLYQPMDFLLREILGL